MEVDHEGYLDPAHPAQRSILTLCARMVGEDLTSLPIGVDGCGIPVFATSLRNAARAFATMVIPESLHESDARAVRTVCDAMTAHPWYVSGTDGFDTRLMEVAAGTIAAKGGAEGVQGAALMRMGLGFALKVTDGAARAVAPAVTALLGKLGALDDAQRERLRSFAKPPVLNVAGREVGTIVVRFF
jgi:L-asparaginase II